MTTSTINTPAATRTFSLHPAIQADVVQPLNLDFSRGFEQQVRDYFDAVPDMRGFASYGLPGQAVAAILALPVIEMACGFPVTPIYDIGKKEVVGNLDLGEFRHHEVRSRRADLPAGEAYPGFTVIDGAGRGLTADQRKELEELLDSDDIRVVPVPTGHMDFADPTKGVVEVLVESGLTKEDMTSGKLVYLPAGMGLAAVVQATAIYGLSETWPKTVRLNRRPDGSFGVDEVVDPQGLRQYGVALQAKWAEAEPKVVLSGNVPDEFRQALAALAEEHGVEVRG